MVREGYVVYTLEVVCYDSNSGRRSIWRTYRRYSQFDDLHSGIIEQVGVLNPTKIVGIVLFGVCFKCVQLFPPVWPDSTAEIARQKVLQQCQPRVYRAPKVGTGRLPAGKSSTLRT